MLTSAHDKINATVASMAVVSPWWLPTLGVVSQAAKLILPILGVIWLVLQIYVKWKEHRRNSRK